MGAEPKVFALLDTSTSQVQSHGTPGTAPQLATIAACLAKILVFEQLGTLFHHALFLFPLQFTVKD